MFGHCMSNHVHAVDGKLLLTFLGVRHHGSYQLGEQAHHRSRGRFHLVIVTRQALEKRLQIELRLRERGGRQRTASQVGAQALDDTLCLSFEGGRIDGGPAGSSWAMICRLMIGSISATSRGACGIAISMICNIVSRTKVPSAGVSGDSSCSDAIACRK